MLRNKAENNERKSRLSVGKSVVYGAAAIIIAGGMALTPAADLFRSSSDPGSYVLAEEKYGWQKEDGKWYYYLSGKKVYLDKQIGGKWFFFDRDTGELRTGFVTYNGHTYESTVDNNVWAPDVYGWSLIE